MSSFIAINHQIMTPPNLLTTTTIPSFKDSGVIVDNQLSRSRSSDVEQTPVSGQHKKKKLLSEPDFEASSAQVSRRVQPRRNAKLFESVEIPEERKRRKFPIQRQPLQIETRIDHESIIGGSDTHLELSEVESTHRAPALKLSVPSQPSAIPKEEFGELLRCSDALSKVQSTLHEDGLEELDKATYYGHVYRKTKKTIELLKVQLRLEKKTWKEEKERKEAGEIERLLEEKKSLSKLMDRKERRIAKLKKRSLTGTRSTSDEALESRKAPESPISERAQEKPDGMLPKSKRRRPENDSSKGYLDRKRCLTTYSGRKSSIPGPSQKATARRPGLIEKTKGDKEGTLASVPSPNETPSSKRQGIQKDNQETGMLRQTQANSVGLWASEYLSVPISAMRDHFSTAPSAPTSDSREEALRTKNAAGNANPQASQPLTPHNPLQPNNNHQPGDSVRTLLTKKRKALYAAEKTRQPGLPSNVPMALRKSDQELIQVGKLANPYERHQGAPYAFTRLGHVRTAYLGLGDAVDATGASVWTWQELRRMFKA